MNVKKKLTSVLSLTLALCMLLSTVALALDTGVGSADAGDSSYSESIPTEETDQTTDAADNSASDADASAGTDTPVDADSSGDADPAEPADPTDPADAPVEGEGTEEEPTPDTMEVNNGWAVTVDGTYTYTYWEDNTAKVAGAEGNYSVLYLSEPESTNTGETMAAGYYYFQDGVWANHHTDATHKRYKNIGVVKLKNDKYQVTSTYSRRMLTVKNGVGEPYTGYELGTESTPNLYYYYKGDFQTTESKEKLSENDGYHSPFDDGKLYYASETTLSKTKDGKPWPYATPFTGRRTEDGFSRRYEKGLPYVGYGLGTQKTPNLYYYVDGYYNKYKEESKSKLESPGTDGYFMYGNTKYYGGDGWYKYDGKWYYATTDSLENEKTSPYSILANKVYRTYKPNGKLYYYKEGKAYLYTGVYKLYYYDEGVKQTKTGWTKISGKWYYFKSGKAVTGWQNLSRNSKTYKYYFKSDGTLVDDLFTYFGKSYLEKKMMVQINRTTHTADILLYNSSTKAYDIPAKSFVCSTPVQAKDFKAGTYSLSYRRRWWTFTNPDTGKVSYFQYGMRIAGTSAALIHSSAYTKQKENALNVGNYNKLGSNQSYYCIRFQCGNCKILYDCVGKQGSKKVKVKFYSSSNKGPHGKITLADTTGKLPKGTKYDPTDPAAK